MRGWNDRTMNSEQPEAIIYDDGGSGLLDACTKRFAGYGCTVQCDSRHAVWVKHHSGAYSIGLAPWLLERQPMNQMLDNVERKIRNVVLPQD